MSDLRKQIEMMLAETRGDPEYMAGYEDAANEIIGIIDTYKGIACCVHCPLDRDRLARALLSAMSDAYTSIAALEAMAREDADAIIAALEEQE